MLHLALRFKRPRARFPRTFLVVLALALACAGAARADVFQTGEFVTYAQSQWGGSPSNPGAALVLADYSLVYAGTSDMLTVGLPSPGFSITFDGSVAVTDYLPAVGSPAPLNQNYLDPSSTSSGQFGGDVLALQLNVDFSTAGFLAHPAGTPFGNLVLANMSSVDFGPGIGTLDLSALDGLTVREFLADANTCLGGGTCISGLTNVDLLAAVLDVSFDGGTPTLFAQDNLVAPVPEPPSLLLLIPGLLGLGWTRRRFRRGPAVS